MFHFRCEWDIGVADTNVHINTKCRLSNVTTRKCKLLKLPVMPILAQIVTMYAELVTLQPISCIKHRYQSGVLISSVQTLEIPSLFSAN